MGTTLSSGQTTVSGSVTTTVSGGGLVGLPVTIATASRTSAGTSSLTVGANKAWRVFSISLWTDAAGTADAAGDRAVVNVNSVSVVKSVLTGATSITSPGVPVMWNSTSTVNYAPNYVLLTAGQTIDLVTTGGSDWTISVSYYEYAV